MSHQETDYQALSDACAALEQGAKTLLLSTLSAQQIPEISYAPYWKSSEGEFYIFISELAAHTQNLLHHQTASVMFIADEKDSRNLFARERLTYQCRVQLIEPEAGDYIAILDEMSAKFGNIMAMLRTLADFKLFRLIPEKGTYVVGFGRAYEVEPSSGRLVHISAYRLAQP